MNKRLFSLVILLLATFVLSAQSKKQIKEQKIKTCTEMTTLYEGGKETSTYKSGFRTFDKEGNTTEDTEFNTDGSVKRKEITKYSGKNKVEEVVDQRGDKEADNAPKPYKKLTYKYDGDGDKTEEVEYDAAGTVVKKTTYAYNKNKDKTFEMVYDGAGKLLKKTAYGYDGKGLKISKSIYGPGDVLLKMVKYTYGY
jgi:hypothetical protein